MTTATESKYPSQATLIATYGCNKYQLGDRMRNSMHIEDAYLPALSVYRMRHGNGLLLRNTVDGQLEFKGTNFNIIYHNCSPYTAKRASEIRLSFRAAQEEFNLEPIVLVQIVVAGDTE